MELISSMTGKSPSTTGAGSEGALTKGPFNALPPIIDLNAALVSYALTGYDVFISAAGHIGPKVRVDHDISLLIPEVWCRMAPAERQPAFLIENGYFEKCEDFVFDGKKVLASRLGWRMTASFVRTFFGRVFNYPHAVFTEEILRPEKQDMAVFADGMDNIVSTHKEAAARLFCRWQRGLGLPAAARHCCTSWPTASTRAATRTIPNSAPCSRAKTSWPAIGMPRVSPPNRSTTSACGAATPLTCKISSRKRITPKKPNASASRPNWKPHGRHITR